MKKFYSLVAVLAASFTFAQTNLVQNPGFEDGVLEPWVKGWTASYTAPTLVENSSAAKSGDWFAQYNPTATTGFYQKVPVTTGVEYTLSFWYKSTGNGNGARLWSPFLADMNSSASIWLTAEASDDPLRSFNDYFAKSATWKQETVTFTVPEGASVLQLHVRAYNNSSVAFDDFMVVEGSLSVSDQPTLQNAVKMNTVVTDKLVLTLPEKATVNIYTIDGKLVSSDRVENGGSINTQSLAKGVYVVVVDNGSAKVTQKIVKK